MASPSHMFSCVDAQSILKSPINDSKAKYHWSFKGNQRFPKQKGLYCDQMYDLPTTKAKRTTSFGYGRKTDLQVGKNRHNVSPPPNTYNLNTFVDTNMLHKSGFNMAIGRELTTPRSYIELQPTKMPGPGTYEEYRKNETPKWTMRPQTSTEFYPRTTQKIVPGPGNYKHYEAISPNGRYGLSKYKNSLAKTWNPKSSERFYKSTTDVPGPGTYRPKNDLEGSGKYVLSNNKSNGKRMILLSKRGSFVDQQPSRRSQTPGPGTYRLPSDFGIYDHLYQNSCSHMINPNSTNLSIKISQSQLIDTKPQLRTPATATPPVS